MSDSVSLRLSEVSARVTVDGLDDEAADAVRRACRGMRVRVEGPADVDVRLPDGADAASALRALEAALIDGIAEAHARRGIRTFGAPLLLVPRGAAVALIATDAAGVDTVLRMRADGDVVAAEEWAADLSGSIVDLDDVTTVLAGGRRRGGGARRLVGALLVGGDDGAQGQGDGMDEILALVRHLVAHGSADQGALPVTRGEDAVGGALTVRRVAPSGIAAVRAAGEELVSAAASPAPARLALSTSPPKDADGGERWFRGPVRDHLDLGDAVVVVPRGRATAPVLLLGDRARSWRSAHGVVRTELLAADVFDAMRDVGLLHTEPSWAVHPDAVWTADDERVVVVHIDDLSAGPIALDGSAKAIWDALIAEPHLPLSRLVGRCAEMFDVDGREIAHEVSALIDDLRRRGLVGWL